MFFFQSIICAKIAFFFRNVTHGWGMEKIIEIIEGNRLNCILENCFQIDFLKQCMFKYLNLKIY